MLGVAKNEDQPLSRTSQKQMRPLPAWFYQPPRESLVRPTLECIHCHALQSLFREQSRQIRNLSNERDRRDLRKYWTIPNGHQREPEWPEERTYPFQVSVRDVVRVKIVETFGHIQ